MVVWTFRNSWRLCEMNSLHLQAVLRDMATSQLSKQVVSTRSHCEALTMWGTYWMAWGFLQALAASHTITIPPLSTPQHGFEVWFIPLALFTSWGAIAAIRENVPLFVVLATVGAGSAWRAKRTSLRAGRPPAG
jgi:hypothetical protein